VVRAPPRPLNANFIFWLISTKQTTCEQSNGGNMDSKYNFSSEMKDEDEDQDLIAYIKVI
jgi:hypothetical protein